ncbi:helix-turn-helix domain-containing protein [Streptomyces radicis]|uniref:XRE family transcriptional regulator n=1 Tax=Streptomyces radicis TaxID=1750517 RepID=A0A3A9VTA7_9ACTN|nr:helix-turn-helix transcriptional regulator [Streptomyces radicis]RKN03782.1 XRE family transcriptional regulator [Streptomyces radicis]RKN13847.1 XRE family transcriptional regulator [Streptomyces radicis]
MAGTDSVPNDISDLEYFGGEVKRARLGRKLTQAKFAEGTGYTQGHVSNVESGRKIPSAEFARRCDHVLGTEGIFERLRERLLERGHPSWFLPFVKQESTAVEILIYSLTVLPGLLQTPDYARAVFEAYDPWADPSVISGQVTTRMRRKKVLSREAPPVVWAVIHESALRMQMGGPEIMREQYQQLGKLLTLPKVTVQVLPFRVGAPPSTEPLELLRQADGRLTLYADTIMGGQMSEDKERVDSAVQTYERLRADALGPRESAAFIAKIAEEDSHDHP